MNSGFKCGPHATVVPPAPMNKAAGHMLLMVAAVEHFKTTGQLPGWAK